jgi:hypothetical protein
VILESGPTENPEFAKTSLSTTHYHEHLVKKNKKNKKIKKTITQVNTS